MGNNGQDNLSPVTLSSVGVDPGPSDAPAWANGRNGTAPHDGPLRPTPAGGRAAIDFDDAGRCFVLRTRRSAYVLRVTDDGRVLHAGWAAGADAAGLDAAALIGLGEYEEPNFIFRWDADRYELPAFGDVATHDVAIKASFPEPPRPPAAGEALNLPVRDLRPRYASHEIVFDAVPGLSAAHGHAARKAAVPRPTLRLRLRDAAYDFGVTLCYRVTPEHDVIERWVELDNRTGLTVTVEALAFASVHLPAGEYALDYVTGGWGREFTPERRVLAPGKFVLDQRGLNTGHAGNPFFLLAESGAATEEAGPVWFGALAYSGNWALRFESPTTGVLRVHGGYESGDFELRLAPGDTHATPAMVLGLSDEGRGGASRRLHRFARDYVLPHDGTDALRPVLYNSWEATMFDVSHAGQAKLARVAADLGVELFVVDDGWFGGRRHDKAGLGDWTVNAAAFPDGLGALIDEVKSLGMQFGLWFEPEMINADSDLYRAHPDWVLHFPGRPRTEHRNQLILDFGRAEVVEHVHGALDAMLRRHDIRFIKWDMNRMATEPGSPAGKAIWTRHVQGLYSVIDRLRSHHPTLHVQTCSGGGGRVDYGILQRADQAWTSDSTDAFDRVPIQEGFSLAYPPRVMEAWVTAHHNHISGRDAPLDLRFDVAMRGVLGIGSPLDQLSADELDVYRRKIAFYKRLRPAVQNGDLYRLVWKPPFSAWLTVLPDASAAVYSCIVTGQHQGEYLAPVKLRGLDATATYTVEDEHGKTLGRYPGGQLMTLGLPGDAHFGGNRAAIRSRTLLLTRDDA